jgi:hypothetical protein
MDEVEMISTYVGAAIFAALAGYWLAIVALDGREGSFIYQPLTGGHCLPPYRLYGLSCREWVVVSTSALADQIVLVAAGVTILLLAARWRRTLLAVIGAMVVVVITVPSLFAALAGALVVMYAAYAWLRLARLRSTVSRSDTPN